MKNFELTHIINNNEYEAKLTDLAQRCKDLNGWSEKDLLQYAVNAMPMEKIWLAFLEDMVVDMEQTQKQNSFLRTLLNKKR